MVVTDMAAIVTLKDALGVNLYSKVSELTSTDAGKITGMLLECKKDQILRMLENKDVLKLYIETAQETLKSSCDNNGMIDDNNGIMDDGIKDPDDNKSTSSNESLAEELYDKITNIVDCDLMAAKITGMLLDLDSSKLNDLMTSEEELKLAVEKARTVLLETKSEEFNPHEDIADEIYTNVEKKYPELAPQITGMLLELDTDILKDLLTTTKELDNRIEEAFNVLSKSVS
ncbi:uncharacterized protein LOC126822367 [Patella vulgata]|uniref:uncharacterized protein LOC126822367 n=1 Tax=Patella vulgata TaxID=6465 RepID=UPI0024A8675B|nr:uncharacterized protein LOC126822367 [Patella vulgata]